jgi:hypothetical protein
MQVVYARWTQQVSTPDGGRHSVIGGQHWPADDPVVKAAPDGLFDTDPRYGVTYSTPPAELAEEPVEQATAGPGEKRNVRRG